MPTAGPYADLPGAAFWRSGVAEADPRLPEGLYRPKWPIDPAWRIGSAGSCFAQHITRALRRAGREVLDAEPPPPALPEAAQPRFGYGTFSARYGNIYTLRQLLQLAQEAAGLRQPREVAWEKDGRWMDALRPAVEPEGLDTPDQVLAHRAFHIARVRWMFRRVDLLVFTLGLTEAWVDTRDGTVFPTAPGTIAGTFDPSRHALLNLGVAETLRDFDALQDLLRQLRKGRPLRWLLTVSPVPLTATASGRHVLAATTYSKAVLRAVAGELAETQAGVDYFPAFEIVTHPAARGAFFDANLRTVTAEGVGVVMREFFRAHPVAAGAGHAADVADASCEDALLEAFAR